jgi:Family of unknown function (DUF5715)
VIPVALSVAVGLIVWGALHFTAPKLWSSGETTLNALVSPSNFDTDRWQAAVEKVKADRTDPSNAALNVPSELRHYEERHWFLAAQVAEVKKQKIKTCQDFVELAAMIQRGEMVPVPVVTDDYVLLGVGAKADDGPFDKYEDDQPIPLYDEAQLREEYTRLESLRGSAVSNKSTSDTAKSRDHAKSPQQQRSAGKQSKPVEDEKTILDRYYNDPAMRQTLFAGYDSLQAFAQNFRGRSYDLQNSDDRQALKMAMLSSLRPQALKVLEEIAKDYRIQYDRPLPVSSLVRPEQYQHTLRRFNRNATTIDTPPHSTGLAFDIDYRYMSVGEQNYLMAALARLKDAGRIEVIRERNANYHVFAFLEGVRPSDDLIAASLEEAGAVPDEAENNNKQATKPPPDHKKTAEKSGKSKRRAKR